METIGLYERLLAEVGRLRGHLLACVSCSTCEASVLAEAARAALELHKPEFFGGHIACLACSPGMPPPLLVVWSKCETVRAIARALDVPIEGDQQ